MLKERILAEASYCLGKTIEQLTPSNIALKAQVEDCDARKSEAVCLTSQVDDLDRFRTFLARGNLEASRKLSLDHQRLKQSSDETEFMLEQIRLLAYEGNWRECLSYSHDVLHNELSALTRMTIHQVRSVAFFETNEPRASLQEIEKVRIVSSLYSFAPTRIYAEILAARILARINTIDEGKKSLDLLWNRLAQNNELNRDRLLFLMRAELDIERLSSKNVRAHALSCLALADAIGNDLYRAHAMIDLHFSEGSQLQVASNEITELCHKYKRVSDHFEKLKELTPNNFEPSSIQSSREIPQHIILIRRKMLVQIQPFEISKLQEASVVWKTLHMFKNSSSICKLKLFSELHGGRKFIASLHSGYIRTLTHRIRSTTGLKIESTDGNLSIRDLLFIH